MDLLTLTNKKRVDICNRSTDPMGGGRQICMDDLHFRYPNVLTVKGMVE